MHKQFRKLLEKATGKSQYIMAIVLDIRVFTPFCQTVDSLDVATYIKKIYMKIIDDYFSNASFYKPTGDGLLVIIPYSEESLKEIANSTMESCLNLLEDFGSLCDEESMINFDTPNKIGIGMTRGSACCITSEEKILDYSGKTLNLASRLMDIARPSGIVLDSDFGLDLLSNEKKTLFLEDAVYIRGIAEEKPVSVYYTKKYTVISDLLKNPIKEPKLQTDTYIMTFKKFKLLGPNFMFLLKKKPLDKKYLTIVVKHPALEEQELVKGFMTVYVYDVKDEKISYAVTGEKRYVYFEVTPLAKIFESAGLKDKMKIRFEVTYPTK